MKYRRLIAQAPLVVSMIILATDACSDQSSPQTLSDGSHLINKSMYGFWDAPGGSRCRWWIQSKSGVIGNNGNTRGPIKRRVQKSGRAADQSQTVLFGVGDKGLYLKSDNCGGWKKR